MCSRFRFGLATVVLVGLAHGSPPPTATYMSLEDFYHGVHDESFNNILNLTSSSGSATWVPISEAVATGNVAPMRIALNYELAALDSNSTCSIAGQKMQLAGYDDTAVEATYTCTEADIATVEKLAVVQTYVSFMSSYIASLVSVPNVWTATPLTLAADSYGAAYTAGMASKMVAGITTTSYSGEFDVVVLVSMRPHSLGSESGLESYSSCLIRDQFRRCVVANINFCPAAVISNPSTSQQAAITARGYATAIHEMLHILNAVKPYGRFFINEDGSEPLDSDVCVQTGDVRRVKTPSVLAVAHQQFSCAELDGVAVEDSQYGLGIHWEATLAGPEIMSVGDWTGETYVSDLTCAFLEDTGYYTCDYSKLGSLTVGTTLEAALAENIFSTETRDAILKAFEDPFNSEEAIAAAEDEISRETLVTNRSVGYLRWGRNAGCQFLAGIPSEFGVPPAPAPAPSVQNQRLLRGVASLSYRRQLVQEHLPNATLWSRYLCEDAFPPEELVEAQTAIEHVSRFFDNIEIPVAPATGYCTSDNRMTATCGTVEVTDMDDNTVESHCEAPALNAALDSNESFWRCPKNSTQLPYYAAHDGARVVGINPALEYAPAFVGYQSCRNLNASQGFSITNGARAFLDAMTLFDGMDDDIIEGDGQAHCENCRCFKSSLAPSEDALELNFAPAGKCYVTNCYHDSYLQVGLVGEDGITWYKCPDGGGDLLVPGFSGSITCPDAETFCRQELITYVFMSETDSALQWVFWIGIVLAGVIVLVIIILIWKTIEKTCRACCGLPPLDMYDVDGDGDADWKEYFAMHKKPCTSQVLIVSNLVWILVGVVLIACAIDIRFFGSVVYPGVQKHVAPFTGLGLGLLIYGILGTIVACEGRPNFKTLSYFYCTMFSCFAVVFFAVGVYFLADPMQAEVGKYWNELRWYFPDNIQQANFSYAVELAQEFVDENFWIFGLVAIFIFLNLALSVVFAGLSIQSKIIVENFELVFNIGIGILAGVFIGFGLYYTVDVDQNVVAMLAILLVPLLFISVFGVIVFCIRNDSDPDKVYKCYIVYIVILVLTLVLAVAFAVVLFLLADDFPALVANNLTADQILAVINQWSSGDSWGIEELMVWGAGLMRLSASAVVVIVIMLLFVLGATAAILDFNKRRGDRAKVGNELELQKLRKGAFWERVTYVFNYLDAFLNGLGDGVVTVGELRSFFRGDDDLAGYFVKEIDGYARYRQDAWELTAADDGQITLDEWYSFVDYLGEKNKKHAEEGLELFERYMAADPKYDRVGRRKGPFWERCNAAFDAVDSGPVKGDGVLTFTELKNFFRGNEELSTYFISNIDLYSEEKKRKGSHDDSSDSSDDELEASLTAVPKGDGVITLAEWYAFFDFLLAQGQIEALRALAKFEQYMKTTELSAASLMEGSKTGRAMAVQRTDPIWKRINAVFDAVDSATAKNRDGDVTVTEMKKFFAKTPELHEYYENTLKPTLTNRLRDDSVVTLDEWYNHFDEVARRDSDCKDNDVATSVDVAKQLTFLETQAGLLPQSKAADPSKESSFSHGVIWNRIRKLFDFADAQLHSASDGYRDNELSMEELRAFFKGDNRVADRYLEDIDEFSHEATARDGYISLEEWHDYFQGVANKDQTCPSNNVEASVEVRKKLEVFEMYMKVSKEDTEAKLNGDDAAGKTKKKKKRKKKSQRLSEHYTESDSALLEAKLLARTRKVAGSHTHKAERLESKIKARQETKQALKEKKKRKKKTKKYQVTPSK